MPTFDWKADVLPQFVKQQQIDQFTSMITRVVHFYKWLWPYFGPTLASLSAEVKDPVYGDPMVLYYDHGNKYLNLYVTDGSVMAGPFGAQLLVVISIPDGKVYNVFFQFRDTIWPGR